MLRLGLLRALVSRAQMPSLPNDLCGFELDLSDVLGLVLDVAVVLALGRRCVLLLDLRGRFVVFPSLVHSPWSAALTVDDRSDREFGGGMFVGFGRDTA